MSKLVTSIPDGDQRGWTVKINGAPVAASHVRISNPRFGDLSWGQRPEGSVGWMWEEIGGGGHGIVPWCLAGGSLSIGMVKQERDAMPTGWTWNIPRGFLDPGSTHLEGAQNEMAEETGYSAPKERFLQLEREPANPNSTFFDTSRGGGFVFFGFQVLPYEVVSCDDPPNTRRFRDDSIRAKTNMGERILTCRFFPWRVVATTGDMFSNAGVARLVATVEGIKNYL